MKRNLLRRGWVLTVLLSLCGCAAPQRSVGGDRYFSRTDDLNLLRATAAPAEAADGTEGLEIYVFAVGQADSMLVVAPTGKTLLVDAGEPVSGRKVNYKAIAGRIREITGGSHLDYFLLSHFHSDHVGSGGNGLAGLVDEEGITIDTVIDAGDGGGEFISSARRTFNTYVGNVDRWLEGGKVAHREVAQFGSGQVDLGGGVTVEILLVAGRTSVSDDGALAKVAELNPGRYADAPASENDLSIAMEISLGDFELFTAGDLTGAQSRTGQSPPRFTHRSFGGGRAQTYTNVESWLVESWIAMTPPRESDVEIYRVTHHGSDYSSLPDIVDRLDPEFMIYSCGGGYGHPSPSVVKRSAETAWQYVTSRISRSSWQPLSKFSNYGEVIGEVQVSVLPGGGWYYIGDELHKAYSDSEESGEPLAGGSGEDAEEHLIYWIDDEL